MRPQKSTMECRSAPTRALETVRNLVFQPFRELLGHFPGDHFSKKSSLGDLLLTPLYGAASPLARGRIRDACTGPGTPNSELTNFWSALAIRYPNFNFFRSFVIAKFSNSNWFRAIRYSLSLTSRQQINLNGMSNFWGWHLLSLSNL